LTVAYPILGLAFTLTHSGFRWTRCDRLVRKNPNPELAFALHVASKRNTSGFDLGVGDPGPFQGLKAEFAEVDPKIT
jgi:hypothetical protein